MDDKIYINTAEGLSRVGGSMVLYKKLLGKFTDGHYLDELDGFLTAGDMEGATRSAHTIKGVAANLGLTALTAAALKLETFLKNGEIHPESLSELRAVYEITERALAQLD